MTDFTLPELGENITAGDVLRVLVKPGDTLAKDQPVLELETDKATIEVPSSVAGQVKEIKVKAGEKVKVGQAILSVDEGGAVDTKFTKDTKDTKDTKGNAFYSERRVTDGSIRAARHAGSQHAIADTAASTTTTAM